MRAGREATQEEERTALGTAASGIAERLAQLERCATTDEVRGCEGEAAHAYFGVFGLMVREDREAFAMHGRTRARR